MRVPTKHRWHLVALAAAGVMAGGAAIPALAATPAATPAAKTEKVQSWLARGGTVGVRWNRELAADLGLTLGAASGRAAELSQRQHEMFNLQPGSTLEFDVRNGNLRDFSSGTVQASGGYVIDTATGRIDLSNFRLVPRAGSSPPILDLVSADGKAWFYIDRLMYELTDDATRLAVRTMDLRVSPELAQRLGHPEAADWAIADLQMTADIVSAGPLPVTLATYKWAGAAVPGVAGATYQADLFMQSFVAQYSRCNGCTGVGGIGRVVFTPSSTLRNNVNNGSAAVTVAGDALGTSSALYAADIPWYTKFSGNYEPYGNDQHPFLIWNLYRLNADGSIDQIGRSGVKHAFLTVNSGCLDDPGNSHVLGRGCSDTYGVGNNDSSSDLGPRSEIIPATNQWGRCGSIYDTNCDGIANASPNTVYDQRLLVRESQISGTDTTGATFLFESWYLARGDVNVYNSMATKRVTFTRGTNTWSVGGNDQYKLGPAIDRWVDPAAPGANARSSEVATSEGRIKVAVKTTELGGGLWRYDYAVMNVDFARAITSGAEPNLRVLNNAGLSSITIPVGTATLSNLNFSDGDLDPLNDWSPGIASNNLIWATATRTQTLNWGTLYRFSFTTDRAPTSASVSLQVANRGSPSTLAVPGLLAPGGAARVAGAR